jgi:molybdopterin converting factor small subunit
MAEVKFWLPSLLAEFAGDQRSFVVSATTVGGALAAAMDIYPLLRTHLQDEGGVQRPHVNVFYNDTELRQLPSLEAPVRQGDEITIIQSVSGG